MHHQLDAATMLRQRAAEIDRMVVARHQRPRTINRAASSRSAIRRVIDQLRAT
jgi:hypothetical protein